MNWYFADGKTPVGPIDENEFDRLAREGRIGPDTLVWHDGMDKWRPRREIAPAPEALPPAASTPRLPAEPSLPDISDPRAYTEAILASDRTVDVWRCIGRAWEFVMQNFGRVVSVTAFVCLLLFLTSNIPYLGLVVPVFLKGPMLGGLYWFYLKLMRGWQAGIGDVFSGFGDSFKQLLCNGLVTSVISYICLAPGFGMMPQVQQELDMEKALRALLFLSIGLLPLAYLSFIWVFSLQLTIDKRIQFWPAMEISRRVVNHHAWRMALLLCAAGLIAASGAVLFGIGVLITLPVYIGAVMFAYEDIFGEHDQPTPELPGED